MRHFVLVFVLGLAASGVVSPRAATACQMQELGELPLSIAHGQVSLDAQIDGRPVRMIVDTGSAATILFRSTAQRLGLVLRRTTGVVFYGVGGKDQAASARIKEFRIANLVARDYDLFVSGGRNLGGVAGLLGARFLLQADVEFDLPDRKLRFFKPVNCQGDQVVYWGKAYAVAPMIGSIDDRIMVTVRLNGNPTYAQMDTGAASSVVTVEAAAKAGVDAPSGPITKSNALAGLGPHATGSSLGLFSTFEFGDEKIANARLKVADLFHEDKEVQMDSHIPTAATDEPRMLLGADFFQSHRVYVSRGQRKVYVSYVGGPVFAPYAAAAAQAPPAGNPSPGVETQTPDPAAPK